ncbi:MAG: DUF4314 domain-containing protein [Eubacteriales bacterium]
MNNQCFTHEQVADIKLDYPKGTRIRLNSMSDPYSPVEAGTEGTVKSVDSLGTLHINWDNGRTLGLILSEDSFSVISKPDVEQTMGTMGGLS